MNQTCFPNFSLKWFMAALLLLMVAPAIAAPQIFWASDPVGAGETVLLVGDGFGGNPTVQINRLADDITALTAASKEAGVAVQALQASDQSLKFQLPENIGDGVYRIRVSNEQGAATWLLNKPAVYWAQGDQGLGASPDGWIRVFGRNMGRPSARTVLTLTPKKGAPQRIEATTATPWEARFKVPAGMQPGRYDLRLSNGQGDATAWSDVGPMQIGAAESWPGRIFNVHDFGAVGNGAADDTPAVKKALSAAGENGGVVYFPRGRYQMNEPILIPRFVTLRGERRDLVNVYWPDFGTPPEALIQGSNHFALENLTLYASGYRHLIAGDLEPGPQGEPGNVRIQQVTARAVRYRGHLKPKEIDQRYRESLKTASGDTLRLGGENLIITDNDLYGSGRALFLQKPRGGYVARNHFYNGRKGWYSFSGVDRVIFEDNEITGADLMSSGGGINNLGGTPYSQNVFFARNKLGLMHGWDREAMTSDGPGGYYYGAIRNAMAQSLTLADNPVGKPDQAERWKGAGVFILGGKGMGQFAQVQRIDGAAITLDRRWKVMPDASSVLSIAAMQQNYLFIDNVFTDAGVALQYYGTSINHVAAGNKSIRTGGFYNTGRWYHHYQPSWYCQFLDNEILEGNVYRSGANNAVLSGEALLGTVGGQKAPNTAPLALATIHRRNHLHSNAHIDLNGGGNRAAPGIRDVIVENNSVENADTGLSISAGVVGVWERGNTFTNVKEPERKAANE